MQTETAKQVWIATGLLALLMLLTRTGHFGDALHLPDASMAVFFLGGFYARRHLPFVVLLALAVIIDWAVIRYAGVSDFCVTAAYAFLPLGYAVLWYGGRWCGRHSRAARMPLLNAWFVAALCATFSFLISNGSFYWLGGRMAHPDLAGYAAGVWQWGPRFVVTTLAYVGAVLLAHAAWQHARVGYRAIRG